jgi:hypothetical protein
MVEHQFLLDGLRDLGYSIEGGNVETDGQTVRIRTGIGRANMVFRKSSDTYTLTMDTLFGLPGPANKKFLQQLSQRYAYHAAVSKLQEQGFDLISEEIAEGERIHLVMRRTA